MVQIVIDNGSVFVKAEKLLMKKYNLFWTPCAIVTPQNPGVPLTTCQRMEYLGIAYLDTTISRPIHRDPFMPYSLEKYTNLSKQFIRVRVTTLLYTKYYI